MDPEDVLTREAEPPDAVIRYADHACGLIDVFLPATLGRPRTAYPLVVALHGGFWREQWDRTHLRPLADALVDRGFVVATPEYRRGAGAWPDTRHDITTALEAVADGIDAVAPGMVDPTAAYVLTGHSAGGHLALWGGLEAGPQRVRRVVALAPVADLVAAAVAHLGDDAAVDFIGAAPDEQPDRYAEADPMRLLPGEVPVMIVQGTEDEAVPVSHNRAVARALEGASTVEYVELPGVEHFALIDPLAPCFEATVLPAFRR